MAYALITGASSGIGHEFARLFAKKGYDLILVGRNKERLLAIADELKRCKVHVLCVDLGTPDAAKKIHEWTRQKGINVEVLVNNAGLGLYGKFLEHSLEDEMGLLSVNIIALTGLSRLIGEDMAKQGYGFILNVASTAAFGPGPLMASYYASKSYVVSFSEALGNELEGSGVVVSVLCPGPTQSEFHKRAGTTHISLMQLMKAEEVAQAGYDGLIARKRVIVPGLKNKASVVAMRLIPRMLLTKIIRRLQESRS